MMMRATVPSRAHSLRGLSALPIRARDAAVSGTCKEEQRRRRSEFGQRVPNGAVSGKTAETIQRGNNCSRGIPARTFARARNRSHYRLQRSRKTVVATARSASLEIITNDDAVVLLDLQSYVRLSSRELNAALQRLGSGTDWHVVFHIFDHLCLAQHSPISSNEALKVGDKLSPPNAYVATTVLSIAGRHGDLDRVRSIFSWMKAQGTDRSAPTAWTYTAYIQAVGSGGLWREAFQMYHEMRSSGLAPTSHTYSALIRAGARGGRVGAAAGVALVIDMRRDGIKPDVPIASALICAYGILGQYSNAERMLRAFGVEFIQSYRRPQTAALGAKQDLEREKNETSSTLPQENIATVSVESATKPDVKLYTEFIIAACRCGRPAVAARLFETTGFPQTSYTCTAAIKAFGELSEWERAEDIYVMMCQGDNSAAPNGFTCSALLSAYEKCGQWQRALFFLTQLKAADPEATDYAEHFCFPAVEEIHYNIAMSACGKCGKWSHADRLLTEMINDGLAPSAVTYSTLIAAYGNGGEQERAESKFKEMLARGLQPDDYTFVGLMICPASRGDYVTCLDIKDRMVAHDVTPTVHIYNEIIRAAGISKKYELAVEIYQTLVDDGIEPNATTRMLVQGVGKKGVEFYEDQQTAANFASVVAGLVGMAGMMAGRW